MIPVLFAGTYLWIDPADHSSNDGRLTLQGYAIIKSDYASNTKREGLCSCL